MILIQPEIPQSIDIIKESFLGKFEDVLEGSQTITMLIPYSPLIHHGIYSMWYACKYRKCKEYLILESVTVKEIDRPSAMLTSDAQETYDFENDLIKVATPTKPEEQE